MHQGKPAARRKSIKCSFLLLVFAVALVLGTAGGTVAFLLEKTGETTNSFTYGHVRCQVEETFNGTTKSNVTVRNTGTTGAYIRAIVIVTWKDGNGNVYGQSPTSEDYDITYGSDWTLQDGYWYYKTAVNAGDSTPALISNCIQIGEAPAEGYALSVEIIADAVQSEPASAAQEAWGVGI